MKNLPAFKTAIVAGLGIFIGKLFPDYAYFFVACWFCVAAGGLFFFLLVRRINSRFLSINSFATIFFAFAFYMGTCFSTMLSTNVANFSAFAGTVEEVPRAGAGSDVILGKCSGYDGRWKRVEGNLVLSPAFKLNLHVGDRIMFSGRSSSISGARNPGEFDLKSYYLMSGIAGRIILRNRTDILLIEHDGGFNLVRSFVEPLRNILRSKIASCMGGEIAELAKAMVLGERSGVGKEVNEQFVNAGTIHILAVSGLHVGFLSGMLMLIVSILRVPRRLRFFFIAPFLITYALVVGMTPSITRAVIMAIVILFGLFLQRRPQVLNSLGVAGLAILSFSPSQLFTAGFELSFAAVLSIAFFHQKILAMLRSAYPVLAERSFVNSLISLATLTVAATIGTVPLTAYYFNRISLVSIFANLCIVPLAGVFTTMTFTAIGISIFWPWAGGIFGAAAQIVGFAILETNSVIGTSSISSVTISESGWLFALLYFLWLIAVIAFPLTGTPKPRDVFQKKLIFAVLLGTNFIIYAGLLSSGRFSGKKPTAKVYVLDVGQGDAIYLELPDGKNFLVDAGLKFMNYDIGERVVVPFLQRHGVRELTYFAITHLHSDHVGGASAVLDNIKVDNFVYPDQVSTSQVWTNALARVNAYQIAHRLASAGMILDSSLICRVYVLHPNRKYVGERGLARRTRLNDGSVVLKVCVGKENILLVGDIEERVERDLIEIFGEFLRSDLYKAGHHGSKTSSTPEFLRAVRPAYAFISVGARNSFGHPSPEVIDEMGRDGILTWRTDSLGCAFIEMEPDTFRIIRWK